VNKLAKQYEGKVRCEVVPVTAPGAAERITGYGFFEHGMVITDAKDAVLWKEEGHSMTEPAIQAQLTKALQG